MKKICQILLTVLHIHKVGDILVAWLTFLVVKSDTHFPLLGDVASKEMAPSNKVLVDIGIVDGLVEDSVWVIIICWQSWYKILL